MPISPLSKTPVDGMYANYSDFVTLSNNDKYLEDKITAFSLAYSPDATTTYVYDESQDNLNEIPVIVNRPRRSLRPAKSYHVEASDEGAGSIDINLFSTCSDPG